MSAGHRLVAHTADVIVEAWGASLAECLEHAGLALTDIFASTEGVSPAATVPLEIAGDPEELVVGLLEELIYVSEVHGVVAVGLRLEEGDGGRLTGWAEVVPAAEVEIVGSLPKGVSREDLVCRRDAHGWRLRAVVDV